MLESQNKVAWLNTVRVFASFTVILSHYAWMDPIKAGSPDFHWFFAGIGNVGVSLFFAVSGYLASNSLKHSKSIWEFYRRKLIRIIIPFTISYILLGIFFIMLGILETPLANISPFYRVTFQQGNILGIFFSMFPFEWNMLRFFHLPNYNFIGEWFIGMIFYLYFIAPILDKFLRKNFFLTIIITLVIAVSFYHFAIFAILALGNGANDDNLIAWWIFIVRMPEFLAGMVIFVCHDFILRNKQKITYASASLIFLFLIGVFFFLFPMYEDYFSAQPMFSLIFPYHPISFIFSLPMIYLFFNFAEWLNEQIPEFLEKFNNLSDISYVSMLIQKQIVQMFKVSFDITHLSQFGLLFILILLIGTIIVISKKLRTIYKPIEEWMIKNFLVRK